MKLIIGSSLLALAIADPSSDVNSSEVECDDFNGDCGFKSAVEGEKEVRRWKIDPAFAAVGILEIMLTESGYPVEDDEQFNWNEDSDRFLIDDNEDYDNYGGFKRKKRWVNTDGEETDEYDDSDDGFKGLVNFEDYVNSFDGFVEDIDMEFPPEGAMVIDEIVDGVKNHGCWGQKLDISSTSHTAWRGKPIDDLDHSTKLYSQCRHCLKHTGGDCSFDNSYISNSDSQTMYIRLVVDFETHERAWQCEVDQSECNFSMCECALGWAAEVKNYLNNNDGQIEPEIYEQDELEDKCISSRSQRPHNESTGGSSGSSGGNNGSSKVDQYVSSIRSTGVSEFDAYVHCMESDSQLRRRR